MSEEKLRCWPGCMAIISGCNSTPENNGAIVEVLSFDAELSALYEQPIWTVRSSTPRRVLNAFGDEGWQTEFWVPDARLTPITPPPEAEDIFAEREDQLVGMV